MINRRKLMILFFSLAARPLTALTNVFRKERKIEEKNYKLYHGKDWEQRLEELATTADLPGTTTNYKVKNWTAMTTKGKTGRWDILIWAPRAGWRELPRTL